MQELKEKISNGFHRLDMMVASTYTPDPFEGHGDAWDRKFAKKSEPYVMGIALINPIVGVPNAFKTIITNSDIYGEPVTQMDKGSSWISVGLTASAAAIPELEAVNWVYTIMTTIWSTRNYQNKNDNENKE
jgi:hypothetical protein